MDMDIIIIGAILAFVFLQSSKASANGAARWSQQKAPIIGNGGTIWTADGQFFYDGEFWYKLGANGYELIDGQP